MKVTRLNEKIEPTKLILDEEIFTESNELLTEAPFFNKKNPFQKATEKAKKATAKAAERNRVHTLKTIAAEAGPKYKDYKFYIYNGSSWDGPKRQEEVLNLYGDSLTPEVANAIVLTPMGRVHRRGMEDFTNKGLKFDPNKDFYINPGYGVEMNGKMPPEPKADETSTTDADNSDTSSDKTDTGNSEETTSNDTNTENSNSETSEQPAASTQKAVSDKAVEQFQRVVYGLGGAEIYDASGKKLNFNNTKDISKITPETLGAFQIKVRNDKMSVGDWIKNAVKAGLIKEDFTIESMSKVLTEAPQILFNDDEINNPDSINFKDIIRDRKEKEAQKEAEIAAQKKRDEIRSKYPNILDIFHNSVGEESAVDTLEKLFNELVPSQGMCDTVAGEHVRAMMRILFRDSNDGDKFFEGYGLETCGGSAEYLMDNTDKDISKFIRTVVNESWKYDDDSKYTEMLNKLCGMLLDFLNGNEELFFTPNDIDSRDYEAEYITENQPTYEFEFYASDDVASLVDKGVIDAWDLNSYVEHALEYESATNGAEVERPWTRTSTSVTVTNLTKDGLERCEDLSRNNESFWEELVEEHRDELEATDEDEDYDEEDYDDNVSEDDYN